MARPLRIEYEGACYHVVARANEGKRVFRSKGDYARFRWYLQEAKERFGCVYHCCVVMGTYYHMLVETPEGNLNRVVQYVNGSYAAYWNAKTGGGGPVFRGRYTAILVERDAYFLELSRYLHLNPVRAELVERPEEYVQSSYGAYVGERKDPLVTTEVILGLMGGRGDARARYRGFVEEGMGKELEDPGSKAVGGVILGGGRFVRQALKRLKGEIATSPAIVHRGKLSGRVAAEEILRVVADHFGVSREDMLARGQRESRMVAMHLLKTHTAMTNGAIGELCGGISYSAVSQAHRRCVARAKADRAFGKGLAAIERRLSHVKP